MYIYIYIYIYSRYLDITVMLYRIHIGVYKFIDLLNPLIIYICSTCTIEASYLPRQIKLLATMVFITNYPMTHTPSLTLWYRRNTEYHTHTAHRTPNIHT